MESLVQSNPNSRFQVLDAPILAPGVCFVCGSAGGDERKFIDFGKQVDWYGAVYACSFCFAEVAIIIGFTSPEETKVMKGRINSLHDLLTETNDERAQFAEALNASRILLRNCHCGDGDSSDSNVVDASVVEESDGENVDHSPDIDESSGVEGSDSISESASDDEPPKRTRTKRANPSS